MQGSVLVAVALAVLVCMVSGDNTGCDYNTCSKCISAPGCIWCSDPNITSVEANTGENFLHCINKESSNIDKFREACKAPILDPPTEQEITDAGMNVSLTPQRVRLKIRAGESARITLSYEHHVSYPIDLYVLLDGSSSMTSYKGRISDATSEIVNGLNNITTNVQLGFGVFVDKPVLPYTDLNSWKICKGCEETFGFKHILPLTTIHEDFQKEVASAPFSTNTDIPEGLLDALMQVASCKKEVGWREEALRVVVVFTDAGFHLAGDGKLAGIVKPNDRECHLDNTGVYTHSLWQDYPSVGEIKSTLEHNKVTTTFAVSAKLLPLYELLTKQLYYSSCSEMTSDIVALIVEPVEDIITTATLSLKNPVPEIAVNVSSRCKGGEEQNNGTCTGMQPGDKAEFLLDIKINKCPTENQHQELTFQLDGQQQSFVLDIETVCECNCADEPITNADACTNHGDFNCGACECHEGYLGSKCQCIEGDVDNQGIDQKNCMNPNATKNVLCSGQGSCVCGECQCYTTPDQEEVISGRYCECSNHHPDCRGTNGEYCSGNGECQCNKCECKSGWEGLVCSCSSSTKDCIDGEGGTCSNHGECVCNRCQCEEDYEGKHCENMVSDRKCEDHKPCVKCLVFEPECGMTCPNYRVILVSDMTNVYGHLCSSTDEDDCKFLYQFKENGTEVLVWAQEEKECPKEINPWIIVGSVLAGVVLVGIMLLVAWKCITTIKDREEVAKFQKNASKAVWEDNVSPLYKSPTTHVQNPMFRAPAE